MSNCMKVALLLFFIPLLLVHWALYQENFKYSCLNTFLSWWNYSQLRFNWTKNNIYIYIYREREREREKERESYLALRHQFVPGSPLVRVRPKIKKWYLIPLYLTLSMIRYVLRIKWIKPGEGVAPSPTPPCSSY